MTSLSTIAYQMQVLSMANNCNNTLPPPPESLNSSFTTTSSEETYPFELDCTGFVDNTSLSSSSYNSMQSQQSQASSSLSQTSHQSSMKRSHCHTNLSSLGSSVSSADLGVMSLSNTRRMSSPNDGWGYFADTTAR